MSRRKAYKLIILGQGGIGKSEMVKHFVRQDCRFQSMYDPTIQDQHHVTEEIDAEKHVLDVFDVGGFGQFHDNLDPKIRECDGFLIAYAINDRDSFTETREIYNMVTRIKGTARVAIILVGTKCDLQGARKVSSEESTKQAAEWKAMSIETSAATSKNVSEAFHVLVRRIKAIQNGDDERKPTLLCCFGSSGPKAH